jgi:hypothetical protein
MPNDKMADKYGESEGTLSRYYFYVGDTVGDDDQEKKKGL